jgi:hypothetical protein
MPRYAAMVLPALRRIRGMVTFPRLLLHGELPMKASFPKTNMSMMPN